MKATELVELLQKYPASTVLHVMPYLMDEGTVGPVHSPMYIKKGAPVTLNMYFDDYDVQYVDDNGCATMDLIILL